MAEPERPDNPNQSVVRPDQSGPADEGDGAGKAPKRGPGRPPGSKSKSGPDPTTDDENDG